MECLKSTEDLNFIVKDGSLHALIQTKYKEDISDFVWRRAKKVEKLFLTVLYTVIARR